MIMCDWCKEEIRNGAKREHICFEKTILHYHPECGAPMEEWIYKNLIDPETGIRGKRV